MRQVQIYVHTSELNWCCWFFKWNKHVAEVRGFWCGPKAENGWKSWCKRVCMQLKFLLSKSNGAAETTRVQSCRWKWNGEYFALLIKRKNKTSDFKNGETNLGIKGGKGKRFSRVRIAHEVPGKILQLGSKFISIRGKRQPSVLTFRDHYISVMANQGKKKKKSYLMWFLMDFFFCWLFYHKRKNHGDDVRPHFMWHDICPSTAQALAYPAIGVALLEEKKQAAVQLKQDMWCIRRVCVNPLWSAWCVFSWRC